MTERIDEPMIYSPPMQARTHELYIKFGEDVKSDLPDFLTEGPEDKLRAYVMETRGVDLPNFMSGIVFKRVMDCAFEKTVTDLDGVRARAYSHESRGTNSPAGPNAGRRSHQGAS